MSDNVAVDHPDVEFIRPCNLCPHMKRITLANIRTALEQNRHIVTIETNKVVCSAVNASVTCQLWI